MAVEHARRERLNGPRGIFTFLGTRLRSIPGTSPRHVCMFGRDLHVSVVLRSRLLVNIRLGMIGGRR